MENYIIGNEFLKKEIFFDCAVAIESLKCLQCADFETHNLVHLKLHFKGGHTLPEFQEKRYKCRRCNFQTYSKFISSSHRLINTCIKNGKVNSKTGILEDPDLECQRLKKKLHTCDHCPYGTIEPRNLKRHILAKHTAPDQIQWFECAQCSYKCIRKHHLKSHMDHKHVDEKSLKCDRCPFETKHQKSLKDHVFLKHTDLEHIHWFQCGQCPHKSKTQRLLKCHVNHKHGSESIKCHQCEFETKYKSSLKNHIVAKHTAAEKIEWFGCERCSFKTKLKFNLKSHTDYVHGNKRNRKICDRYPFEIKHRNVAKRGILSKRAETEEVRWSKRVGDTRKSKNYLKCDRCSYQAKYKRSLDDHILTKHTEFPTIQWFECTECSYKCKRKYDLKKHMDRMHGS